MVVDDNQPTLKADLALLFGLPPGPGQDLPTVQQGYVDWPGVEQALRLERRILALATGHTSVEIEYGVLSLAPEQIALSTVLSRWRGHWSIEDKLHWSRDVLMGEDASRVRSGAAPQTLAALRNTVISLVKRLGHSSVSAARRHFALNLDESLSIVGIV
jgi:hypothetical protein